MVVFQEVAAWGLGVKQRKGEIQVEIQKLNHFKVRVAPEGWNIVEPPEQGLLPHQPDQMMPTSSTSSSSSTSSTSSTPTISSCQLTHGNLKLKVKSNSERVQLVGLLSDGGLIKSEMAEFVVVGRYQLYMLYGINWFSLNFKRVS